MSALGRSISAPLLVSGVVGYFALLGIVLIWWHLSPLNVLVLTLGGLALVAITLRPYLGLHAFIMLLFVENVGVTVGGVTGMTVAGAFILLGWLLSVAVRRRFPVRFDAFTVVSLLFLAWCAVSLVYAIDSESAIRRVLTFAQLVMVAMMFSSVVDSPSRARGIYAAIVFWTGLTAIVALMQYYVGMTDVAKGLVGNRNQLAMFINVAIVCAYLLHQGTSNRASRLILVSTLPLFFLGLALTLSRTGIIVQSMALLAVWYRVARERGFLVLAGSLAALCLVTFLLPAAFYRRVSSIVPVITRQQDTFGMRVRLWEAGLRMIESRPLTGVGPGNFIVAHKRFSRGEMLTTRRLTAHNTYISVGAETGLVGLSLFVLLLSLALGQARRAVHVARRLGFKEVETSAVITEIGILIFLVTGLAGTVEGLKYLWVLIGIAFSLGRITLMSRQQPPLPVEALRHDLPPERVVAWNLARHG